MTDDDEFDADIKQDIRLQRDVFWLIAGSMLVIALVGGFTAWWYSS